MIRRIILTVTVLSLFAAAGATAPAAAVVPVAYGATIPAGTDLHVDDSAVSPNGQFRIRFQGDGNLVEYGKFDRAIWYTGVLGDSANRFAVQPDGNLVMYSSTGAVLWASYTSGSQRGKELRLGSDGELQYLSTTGTVIWRSHAVQSTLYPGDTIGVGDVIRAQPYPNTGDWYATLQPDGNFVVYEGRVGHWSTSTAGTTGQLVTFQQDGNVTLTDAQNRIIWQTSPSSIPVKTLVMQPDGNLVVYRADGGHGWNRGPDCTRAGPCPQNPWVP